MDKNFQISPNLVTLETGQAREDVNERRWVDKVGHEKRLKRLCGFILLEGKSPIRFPAYITLGGDHI